MGKLFQKGNKYGCVPKAGKGVGAKPKAVNEAKRAEMESRLPAALAIIDKALKEGDRDMAIWVYEQARGKATQKKEFDGEVVVRVIEDGEE